MMSGKAMAARNVLRMMSSTVALLFFAANFACAAEQILEGDHNQAVPASHHHGDADSHHDDGGEADCCTSLKSDVPSTQPAVHIPASGWAFQLVVAIFATDSSVVAPHAGLTCDHGPPGTSRPEFLLVSSLSPRSPPVLV
jgi:hypothetical protein